MDCVLWMIATSISFLAKVHSFLGTIRKSMSDTHFLLSSCASSSFFTSVYELACGGACTGRRKKLTGALTCG